MLTQEQLAERLNYVTGSDSAVICGLSPHKTCLQLWMEKTGRVEQEDISGLNHIKFGNFFEQGVADWFQNETGKIVAKHPVMMTHKSLPWMAGNIDFKVVGENAILECKTAYKPGVEWGDGENIIPAQYLMQVAHYCAVGGFDRAYIAVVFALTREMRWYQYDRNLELEDKLINREQDFWINNVKADVCPEPVNEQDILTLYKQANSSPLIADDELLQLLEAYKTVNSAISSSEDTKEILKNKIALLVKNYDTILDNSGKILATWKFTKPIASFDKKKFIKDHPALCKKYETIGDPRRQLRLKGEKE